MRTPVRWIDRHGRTRWAKPWPRPVEWAVAAVVAVALFVGGWGYSVGERVAPLARLGDTAPVPASFKANGNRGRDGCVTITCHSRTFAVSSSGEITETVAASVSTYSSATTGTNFVVPTGVTSITFDVKGAGGGSGGINRTANASPITPGGAGGRAQGTLAVTPGQTIVVVVGGGGGGGQVTDAAGALAGGTAGTSATGNVGNGGTGGSVTGAPGAGRKASGGGGGGRSSVSIGGTDYFIAGGGGGSAGTIDTAGGTGTGTNGDGGGATADVANGRQGSDGIFTWSPAQPGVNGVGGQGAGIASIPSYGPSGTATNGGDGNGGADSNAGCGGGGGGGYGGGGGGMTTNSMWLGGGGGDGFMHASVTSQTFTTGGGSAGGAAPTATTGNANQSVGNAGSTGSVSLTYLLPPTQPGAITGVTAGNAYQLGTVFTLGWGASTDPEARGTVSYRIGYHLNGGAYVSINASTTSTSQSWTPTQAGSYTLDVYAIAFGGAQESTVRSISAFTLVAGGPRTVVG